MELMISDEKTKELLAEVLIDLIKNKKELFYELILASVGCIGETPYAIKFQPNQVSQISPCRVYK